MDLYELNKIAGAILAAALMVMFINEIGNLLVKPSVPEKSLFASMVGADDTKTAEKEEVPPLATLLQAADADKGAKVAKKCVSCHTFEKGGKNKVGPNLYNVLGRDIAAADGFGFSGALTGLEGNWTYEAMDAFLTNPKKFAKGTKMTFGGLKKPVDRADLIAYMRGFADSPPELPKE